VGRSQWAARLFGIGALLAAGVLLAVGLRMRLDSHPAPSLVTRRVAAVRASGGHHVIAGASRTVSRRHPSDRLRDPLRSPALRSYLAARSGSISVAVLDLDSGQRWLYHPSERAVTASIVKVDILETLLEHAQAEHEPLSGFEMDVATGMIEDSDNDDATELWDGDDGSSGIGAYNEQAGLRQTELNTGGYWGLSTTSASDQVQLLRQLVGRHGLLDGASRRYALELMEGVTPDQDWGVSGGVPAGVTVALKNGWLPNGDGWEINSVGYVHGDGRAYLIAVLTSDDPSEGYGIDTIGEISSDVWRGLAPARRRVLA
jgi:beta-lactamase class A